MGGLVGWGGPSAATSFTSGCGEMRNRTEKKMKRWKVKIKMEVRASGRVGVVGGVLLGGAGWRSMSMWIVVAAASARLPAGNGNGSQVATIANKPGPRGSVHWAI